MSELSFEQMLEDSVKTIRNGEIVQGTVIDVKDDEIILNIGYKADGIITKNEYTNDSSVVLTDVVKPGDTMEAKVLKVNDGEGQVTLTYKRLAAEKGNKRLEEAFENQEVLKAPVTQVLDGGLCVNVEEARVFIPASLVSDTYEKDLSKYADQEIEFVITEFNPRRRRIIGNRKQLLLAEKAEKQKELLAKINVGDKVEGVVKNVTDFGAFIDLGGADGLLHISEMSWGRVENPKKVFNVGDKVTVLIKDINGDKIALSLKFPEENPWLTAAEDFAVGNVVKGKVARMTDFGAQIKKESYYQDKIKRGLQKKYPEAFIRKVPQGAYCQAGIPDILMIYKGHYFGFEVKRPVVGIRSKLQEQTVLKIREAGGTAEFVTWPEEAVAEVEKYEQK